MAITVVISSCAIYPTPNNLSNQTSMQPNKRPPVIGLALGGGAARGFAHIGVIKALEASGIKPDMIVGTSAGSVIASVYATGISGNELHRLAIILDEATIADWANPFTGKFGGLIKGDDL